MEAPFNSLPTVADEPDYGELHDEQKYERQMCGCCHRSMSWHQKKLLVDLTGLSVVVIGFTQLYSCDSIPSLPFYVLIFGLVNFVRAVLQYHYTIPEDIEQQQRDHLPTQLFAALGALLPCLAVWGSVVTYPNFDKVGSEPERDGCTPAVFICAFITCTCVWAFCLGALIQYLTKKLKGLRDDDHGGVV